jgi:hypothetical protein
MSVSTDSVMAQLFERPQFSINQNEKSRLIATEMSDLVRHHRARSSDYARICDVLGVPPHFDDLAQVPYLPVSLFKSHELRSVPDDEVFKVMTSSGTTGQAVSRVVLDRETAGLQSKALSTIMRRVIGNQRLPMIIIDTPNVIKDRKMFSARGAGLLGMMPFGRDHFYALDDDMRLDLEGLREFLRHRKPGPVFVFGFTFMVWKYLLSALAESGATIDLTGGTLVHSGGWKKLTDEAVGNVEFKATTAELTGLTRVHNFYGMVEQVGSIFLEGDNGRLYPPNFADVIIRDPLTWLPADNGSPGVVEVLSVLPRSYPGHALLTEDIGIIHGIGDVESGWSGKQLEIIGRVPRSELRGCSDTHAFDTRRRG